MSLPVVEPKFNKEDFPAAADREGAEELTLRKDEEGGPPTRIDTTNVGDSRWGPPLVDEDWHAICQAIHKGRRGRKVGQVVVQVWVNMRTPSNNRKAKTL